MAESIFPELPALTRSEIRLTLARQLHHCNDCGRELNVGDEMAWAQLLGVPFCRGCAHTRGLLQRAEASRSWLAAHGPGRRTA